MDEEECGGIKKEKNLPICVCRGGLKRLPGVVLPSRFTIQFSRKPQMIPRNVPRLHYRFLFTANSALLSSQSSGLLFFLQSVSCKPFDHKHDSALQMPAGHHLPHWFRSTANSLLSSSFPPFPVMRPPLLSSFSLLQTAWIPTLALKCHTASYQRSVLSFSSP